MAQEKPPVFTARDLGQLAAEALDAMVVARLKGEDPSVARSVAGTLLASIVLADNPEFMRELGEFLAQQQAALRKSAEQDQSKEEGG